MFRGRAISRLVFLAAVVAISALFIPSVSASACDPTSCARGGDQSSKTDRVCDVSCLSSADALFGDRGCDGSCRVCAEQGGPPGLKPCRLARLDNFIHSNAQLGNDPDIQTALQAEEALLTVVKALFREGAPYSLPGIGTFIGSL